MKKILFLVSFVSIALCSPRNAFSQCSYGGYVFSAPFGFPMSYEGQLCTGYQWTGGLYSYGIGVNPELISGTPFVTPWVPSTAGGNSRNVTGYSVYMQTNPHGTIVFNGVYRLVFWIQLNIQYKGANIGLPQHIGPYPFNAVINV